jgi:hypothetical protein
VIVERYQIAVKPGCADEFVELVQDIWKVVDPIPHRIYTRITGPFDTVYQELEYEDLRQRQKWWADTGPKMGPFMDRWRALTDTGGGSELMRLVE